VFRTWTDNQEALLRELWPAGVPAAEINRRLGRPEKSELGKKCRALGLPPRKIRFKSRLPLAPEQKQQAQTAAVRFPAHTIISFMPESPTLEMQWRHELAKVRQERGALWTELQGVTR
jgi:hypothetical protein